MQNYANEFLVYKNEACYKKHESFICKEKFKVFILLEYIIACFYTLCFLKFVTSWHIIKELLI